MQNGHSVWLSSLRHQWSFAAGICPEVSVVHVIPLVTWSIFEEGLPVSLDGGACGNFSVLSEPCSELVGM